MFSTVELKEVTKVTISGTVYLGFLKENEDGSLNLTGAIKIPDNGVVTQKVAGVFMKANVTKEVITQNFKGNNFAYATGPLNEIEVAALEAASNTMDTAIVKAPLKEAAKEYDNLTNGQSAESSSGEYSMDFGSE